MSPPEEDEPRRPPADDLELYDRPRRSQMSSLGRLWADREGHLNHARILLRRTREVLAHEGLREVVRRARRFVRPRAWSHRHTIQGSQSTAIEGRYAGWRERHEPDADELERQRRESGALAHRPLVSVVVPVFDPPLDVLREAVDSVLEQTYDRVELCVANAGRDPEVASYLDGLAAGDSRVKLAQLAENLGISGNSNAALALATGELVALLDHDDLLAPFALHAIVERVNEARALGQPDPDVLYSDEDRLAPDGQRILPYLKPDWSPEFLQSYMWPGHLTVYRRAFVESLGGFRSDYDGSQDYDLMLRAAAATVRIVHVPQVLYHWRMIEGSAAAGGKGDARRTNLAGLRDAIAVQGRPARIAEYPFANRVVFDLAGAPLVSIVIPTDDLENARASIRGILASTTYDRFEILVVCNGEVAAAVEAEHGADARCVVHDGPFNFSLKCNLGAGAARGEYLLFLNDDVEPLTEGWIETMLRHAQLPEIGGVSPKLLYADDRIQYAGLVSGVRDLVGTAFHTWPRRDGSYHSMALSTRNVSCLTGACLLLRAEVFHRVGGWDATNAPIAHSDFDLSYRLQEAGLRLVYTPFAELRHLGSVSRRHARPDERLQVTRTDRGADTYLLRRWGKHLGEDPFYTRGMRELLYELPGEYRVVAPPGGPLATGWWERPRVLLVAHDLSASGAPLMLVEAAQALERDGMLVTVTAAKGGPLVDSCLAEGIPVVLDEVILTDPRRAARFMAGFDAVGANTVLSWRVVRQAAALRIPVVWLIHESKFGLPLLKQGGRHAAAAFGDAARVVFPSLATASLYAGYGHTDRHVTIHNGIPDPAVEAGAAAPLPRTGDAFTIAHVGSIEKRKGADVVLDAVRRLPGDLRARTRVDLVGRVLEPGYEAHLRRSLDGLDVRFAGAVSPAEALGYIRDADLFVCTSRDESGPLVVMEAMALGKPLVTTTVGAAAEIVRQGVDGELIAIDDAAGLAGHIERLAGDPGLRDRLGREARATYERHLTAERYGADVTRVFADVLAARQPPAG